MRKDDSGKAPRKRSAIQIWDHVRVSGTKVSSAVLDATGGMRLVVIVCPPKTRKPRTYVINLTDGTLVQKLPANLKASVEEVVEVYKQENP